MNSEKYTKITHKIWELSLLIISIYYQTFNIGKISSGIHTAELLLKHDCFLLNNPNPGEQPDAYKDHANIQFIYYIDFLNDLKELLEVYLAILLVVFFMIVMVKVSYFFVKYTEEQEILSTEEKMINDLIEKKDK